MFHRCMLYTAIHVCLPLLHQASLMRCPPFVPQWLRDVLPRHLGETRLAQFPFLLCTATKHRMHQFLHLEVRKRAYYIHIVSGSSCTSQPHARASHAWLTVVYSSVRLEEASAPIELTMRTARSCGNRSPWTDGPCSCAHHAITWPQDHQVSPRLKFGVEGSDLRPKEGFPPEHCYLRWMFPR
jgi:hypothetical protein